MYYQTAAIYLPVHLHHDSKHFHFLVVSTPPPAPAHVLYRQPEDTRTESLPHAGPVLDALGERSCVGAV